MKTLDEIKSIIKKHRQELEGHFKIKEIALFGSYVRGDQNTDSDLDIMITFREPVGFLFIELCDYLEDLFGMIIDVVTRRGIKSNRWKYIEEDLIYV
jgi:predicted nucleotidyltransferase